MGLLCWIPESFLKILRGIVNELEAEDQAHRVELQIKPYSWAESKTNWELSEILTLI